MFVCGLDPSLTGFAVCLLARDGTHVTRRFASHRLGADVAARIERALILVESVIDVIKPADPQVICIEGYSYMSNERGQMDLGELGGILRAYLLQFDGAIYEVAPVQLKKFVTGKGSGDKTALVARTVRRWGVDFPDNDRFDAYGLARMAGCIAGFWKAENVAESATIAKVIEGRMSKTTKAKGR